MIFVLIFLSLKTQLRSCSFVLYLYFTRPSISYNQISKNSDSVSLSYILHHVTTQHNLLSYLPFQNPPNTRRPESYVCASIIVRHLNKQLANRRVARDIDLRLTDAVGCEGVFLVDVDLDFTGVDEGEEFLDVVAELFGEGHVVEQAASERRRRERKGSVSGFFWLGEEGGEGRTLGE